jgi:hypothetical protein
MARLDLYPEVSKGSPSLDGGPSGCRVSPRNMLIFKSFLATDAALLYGHGASHGCKQPARCGSDEVFVTCAVQPARVRLRSIHCGDSPEVDSPACDSECKESAAKGGRPTSVAFVKHLR